VTRSDRRLSRLLITLLLISVSAGILCFGYKVKHSSPAAAKDRAAAVAVSPTADQPPPSDALAAAATQPATQPDAFADAPPSEPASTDEDATPPPQRAPRPTAGAIVASDRILGPATAPSPDLLTLAKRRIDAGEFLEAREQLNDALQSGRLDESAVPAVKAMLQQINQTVIFSRQHFPDDPYGGTYVVKPGESLAKIAAACDVTWELLARINGIEPKHLRAGATIKIVQGPFFAVVDKRAFTIDLYLGSLPGEKSCMYVTTYPVGLGRDDSTPTGTWTVEPHRKLKHPTYYSPRGEGVIAADDPKNPLDGYWIGLTGTEGQAVGKLSYGIHGTIDAQSIGKQNSMGCIRLRSEDVAVLFDLMVEGKSLVVVKD
jgi:hypothetical protein